MRVLLDTNVWLRWSLGATLRRKIREAITDERNAVFVSAASAWEIAVKHGLGKLALPEAPSTFLPSIIGRQGFELLSITLRHATSVGELPLHHRDPFDRLLIAQANIEGMTLATTDDALKVYAVALLF